MAGLPETVKPETLSSILANLLGCVEAMYDHYDVAAPKRVFINPGIEVPWDNCCEDEGQLWARVTQRVPTATGRTAYPAPATSGSNCPPGIWATTIGVGALRCAHTVNDNGDPPSAGEMTLDAVDMLQDAAVIEHAVTCCFNNSPALHRLNLTGWTPLGPEGGCVGGEWLMTIAHSACNCPKVDNDG